MYSERSDAYGRGCGKGRIPSPASRSGGMADTLGSNPSAERRPSSTLGIGIDGLCVRPRLNAVVDEQQNAISKGVTQIRDRYTLRIQALVG